MPVVVLTGDFGAGKTTYIKEKIDGLNPSKKKMLFALVKNDYNFEICRDSKLFFLEAVNSKNTLMVLDEAKIALPKKIPDTLNPNNASHQHILRILTTFINARKLNNFIFIIYHSMGEYPLWLVQYTDMLVRFRTNDQMQYMRTRFGSFKPIIESIDEYPSFENFTCHEITIRK